MKAATWIPILTIVAFFAPPASALHCNGDITAIETPAATVYLEDRTSMAGDISHWLYLESNGVGGLQTGSDSVVLHDVCIYEIDVCFPTDACFHRMHDTLILGGTP